MSNTDSSSVVYNGLTNCMSVAAPEWEGHTLTGWNTAADGSGTAYTLYQLLSEVDAGLTFYAQWTTN